MYVSGIKVIVEKAADGNAARRAGGVLGVKWSCQPAVQDCWKQERLSLLCERNCHPPTLPDGADRLVL